MYPLSPVKANVGRLCEKLKNALKSGLEQRCNSNFLAIFVEVILWFFDRLRNGADGKLAEVSKELWTITDEAGTGVDTLADGTLYELRVSVADGGAFDLSEAEKEIKISVVLAK